MLGLDTNVVARIVLADDPLQTAQALALIAQASRDGDMVMLSLCTVLELEWVLRSRAKLTKTQILRVLKQLLEAHDLEIDSEPALEHALYLHENSSADFAECLFVAQYQRLGCRTMMTFDRQAATLPGAELLTERSAA